MLRTNIMEIIDYTWPMIVIALVIIVSIRLAWLYKNKRVIIFHRELLGLLFLVYILFLFQVVTFQDVSWSSYNFIFFKEIFRYDIGSKLFYRNVVGNFLMFIPYGFFVSYYLKINKVMYILILSIIASTAIEYVQLLIGRVFDVDDILLNVLGAVVGYIMYRLFVLFSRRGLQILKKCNLFTIIKIVIVLIFLYIILYW